MNGLAVIVLANLTVPCLWVAIKVAPHTSPSVEQPLVHFSMYAFTFFASIVLVTLCVTPALLWLFGVR